MDREWTQAEVDAARRSGEAKGARRKLAKKAHGDVPRPAKKKLAGLVRPREGRRKVAVSVRLDPQVLEWLKGKGAGHLTRINDILVNLMEAERKGRAGR
jgi:uncharacterized protein (DUF4415 family)